MQASAGLRGLMKANADKPRARFLPGRCQGSSSNRQGQAQPQGTGLCTTVPAQTGALPGRGRDVGLPGASGGAGGAHETPGILQSLCHNPFAPLWESSTLHPTPWGGTGGDYGALLPPCSPPTPTPPLPRCPHGVLSSAGTLGTPERPSSPRSPHSPGRLLLTSSRYCSTEVRTL